MNETPFDAVCEWGFTELQAREKASFSKSIGLRFRTCDELPRSDAWAGVRRACAGPAMPRGCGSWICEPQDRYPAELAGAVARIG